MENKKFWLNKSMEEFTESEWESICDQCGMCCIHRLQNDDNETFYTNVSCSLLNLKTFKCTKYQDRQKYVKDCLKITYEKLPKMLSWLPINCSYKILYEEKRLPNNHPLLNSKKDIIKAKKIIPKKIIKETKQNMNNLESYIIDIKSIKKLIR